MINYIKGRSRKLMLPNGEEHKAVYAIVDLNDIKASHNEVTFNDTIGYPTENGRNINDRNYKDDISAQRNVQKIAENLNPETLISLSSTPSGTPIINKDGFVVSGNNRVMSLKLATREYPKNYEKYKEQLKEDAGVFGIVIDDFDNIKIEKPFEPYKEKAQKLIDSGKLDLKFQTITSGVDKGGIVVSISNASEVLPNINGSEIVANSNKYGGKKDALDYLQTKLANYFFRVESGNDFIKYPILVRIDESLPEKINTEVLAAFNQDTKKGERPVDKAIKLSSILNSNERCKNAIISIIDGYDTFSDLYSVVGRNDRKKLAENFVQCGLIPEAQLPIYFDNGEFTENGKDYIETLLSAIILDADALKVLGLEGVKRYRQTLISSLPVLIANETLKEGSLKKDISDAIVIQYKIVQSGGSLSDYTHSQSLFSEDKPSEKGLYINSLLRVGKNTFKAAIKKYTDAVKSNESVSLFGENLSIEEIFDKTIKAVVDESDRKNIEQLFKNEDKIVNKAFGNMRTFEDIKEDTKESGKGVSLGFGSKGNGTTVWDRNRTMNGDYVTVAHISYYGEVKYYSGVFLPDYAKKEIENYANSVKEKMQPQNKNPSNWNFKIGDIVILNSNKFGDKGRKGEIKKETLGGYGILWDGYNSNEIDYVSGNDIDLYKPTVNGVDVKIVSEEEVNPNTDEEFYENIFEQVNPHDSWQGHLIKERHVKQQLNSIVKNATPEDIEDLFIKYGEWFNKNKKEQVEAPAKSDFKYYKGIDFAYKNPFEYNKSVEELLDSKSGNFTAEEKIFMSNYSGYGGLEKFGAEGKGLLYEYYTPRLIVEKMWGLAYKYGFSGGNVLEPSCGVGEFIKFAPNKELVTGYEINSYSAKIAQILYPESQIIKEAFETIFIKNRASIKNKLNGVKKYNLVIGNPPYGEFGGLYAGMGEKGYTKAENYIDYFITRGLDLLETNGLLIMIVGAEVAAGGKPFLSKGTSKAKQDIMEKSILVDAYRLPNGVFDRTDVLSDIIVLRKK